MKEKICYMLYRRRAHMYKQNTSRSNRHSQYIRVVMKYRSISELEYIFFFFYQNTTIDGTRIYAKTYQDVFFKSKYSTRIEIDYRIAPLNQYSDTRPTPFGRNKMLPILTQNIILCHRNPSQINNRTSLFTHTNT